MVAMKKARIFIVDDHPLLRQGISLLINNDPEMEVCGETDSADTALDSIAAAQPDIAILDISLQGASGLELLKSLKARFPRLAVLMLSMHDESIYAQRALRAGASGYIMKHESPEQVLLAIRRALKNEVYLSEELAQCLANRMGSRQYHSDPAFPVAAPRSSESEIFDLLDCKNHRIASHSY
jgi:DNA-binding NarL/FixJ family response regulator